MPVDTLFFLVIYAWNVVAQFVWHFQRALALPVCTNYKASSLSLDY